MRSWRRASTEASATGVAALPARPVTTSRAVMKLMRLVPSAPRHPATRSLRRGSTRGAIFTILASAPTARARTTLEDSERDLTKVVWSCGRNGFIMIPPRTRRSESVERIAALTCHGKRSPMIRMSGPDICTTIGLSAASEVASTHRPRPSAASARVSGVAPCISAWRKKGRIGARPLVALNPEIPPGGAVACSNITSWWTVETYAPHETAGAFGSSFLSSPSRCLTIAASAPFAAVVTAGVGSPKRCTNILIISAL
mmetsp:Transcript_21110/g.50935  ORF Transcript_21110/g.50935 Transcript_21110/m.50935 type:complete len:257 (-) Transcript_21110:5954-6724(-)